MSTILIVFGPVGSATPGGSGWLMPAVICLVFLAVGYSGLRRITLMFRAAKWEFVRATVQSTRVVEHRNRSGTYYETQVDYSYVVAGEYYSGNLNQNYWSESDAYAYIATFPKGAVLSVRVNPRNPEQSFAGATFD